MRLYFVASLILFSSALDLPVPDASRFEVLIAGRAVTAPDDDERRGTLEFFDPGSPVTRWLESRHPERLERLRALPPQELVASMISGLERVLPTALVLFLPFLALALKVLYLRTRTLYVLAYAAAGAAALLAYLPLALRRVYRQSWPWTALKTAVLLVAYVQLPRLTVELAMVSVAWRL